MQVHPRDELAIFLALAEPVYTCGNKFSPGNLPSFMWRIVCFSHVRLVYGKQSTGNPSCGVAKNVGVSGR